MIRLLTLLILVILTLPARTGLFAQPAADTAPIQPASTATIVSLADPTHHINVPPPDETPVVPDRSFDLDPSWYIERVTLSPDGKHAFLVVVQTDVREDGATKTHTFPKDAKASIHQINLDTGEALARYEIPEPYAFKSFHPMSGHTVSRLEVSSSGQSLVASFSPPHTELTLRGLDAKSINSTVFFRWDTRTQALTHEQAFDDAGIAPWRMLGKDDRMLVTKMKPGTWSVESWDARDLSITTLVEEPYAPSDLAPQSRYPAPRPNCVELDQDTGQLSAVLTWAVPTRSKNRRFFVYWLQHYDTQTGRPTGLGIKFKNVKGLVPVQLRGAHLLLREYDPYSVGQEQTLHVWHTRNNEHVVELDVPPPTRRGRLRANLSDDGSALIVGRSNLNLRTLKWSEDKTPGVYSQLSTISPDGRRHIVTTNPFFNDQVTTPTLSIYDLD